MCIFRQIGGAGRSPPLKDPHGPADIFGMDPYGLSVPLLAHAAGVSLATAHRWKRQHRIPDPAARLVALLVHGELSVIGPAWRGFRLDAERIWTPYGFGVIPTEISSIPWRFAQIRALESALEVPRQLPLWRR